MIESTDAFAEGVLGIVMLIRDQPNAAFGGPIGLRSPTHTTPTSPCTQLTPPFAARDLNKAHRLLETAQALGTAESSGMETRCSDAPLGPG